MRHKVTLIPWNGLEKCAKSSITQSDIASLCLKLMRWRIISFLTAELCTFTYYGQDGRRRPYWTYLNRNNSAADCSILLKFDMWELYGTRKLRDCWICRLAHYGLCNSNPERLARLLVLTCLRATLCRLIVAKCV